MNYNFNMFIDMKKPKSDAKLKNMLHYKSHLKIL